VLGDRFEVLAAAIAALPLNLPVAHLHGGEVTEAAMDEQIRHAVTKLSHLHLAAAEPYAARIRQMGEEPWRVHCVGAPGLDRLHRLAALPRAELARRVGLPLDGPLIVATLHPVTLEHEDTGAHAEEFAAALSGAPGDLVLTHPNADTAHRTIAARLERLAAERPRTRLVAALGDDVYCSLLREADCLVGNSSSGLIEAPSFALPAVNVGPRQRGRLRARSVIDVGHGRAEIAEGLRRALSREFRGGLAGLANPYGDGRSAPRIAAALAGVELGRRLLVKRFVDRPGPPA